MVALISPRIHPCYHKVYTTIHKYTLQTPITNPHPSPSTNTNPSTNPPTSSPSSSSSHPPPPTRPPPHSPPPPSPTPSKTPSSSPPSSDPTTPDRPSPAPAPPHTSCGQSDWRRFRWRTGRWFGPSWALVRWPGPHISVSANSGKGERRKEGSVETGGDGRVYTSVTTSFTSSSISFSALKHRCHNSSPTLPRASSVPSACFPLRIAMMRWMSSVARRSRAARRTESGTWSGFSDFGEGWSRCRRER